MNKHQIERMKRELTPDDSTVDGLLEQIASLDKEKTLKGGVVYKRVVALAACLVLCVAAVSVYAVGRNRGFFLTGINTPSYGSVTYTENTEVAHQVTSNNTTTAPYSTQAETSPVSTTNSELYEIKSWELKTAPERYTLVEINGQQYDVISLEPMDQKLIGTDMGRFQASGFDIYSNSNYTEDCSVFEINGLSFRAACAVQYASDDNYYTFINSSYAPETLGEFVSDYAVETSMTAGEISYTYMSQEKSVFAHYSAPNTKDVVALLFSDATLVNLREEQYFALFEEQEYERMMFGAHFGVLDTDLSSITVSRSGYMAFSLHTGICFFIGEQKAAAFFKYVEENCSRTNYETYDNTSQPGDNVEITSPAYDPSSPVTETSSDAQATSYGAYTTMIATSTDLNTVTTHPAAETEVTWNE